jgi:hypothetical protein
MHTPNPNQLLLDLFSEIRTKPQAHPYELVVCREIRNLRGDTLDWLVEALARIINSYRSFTLQTIENAIYAETLGHPSAKILNNHDVLAAELSRLSVIWFELYTIRLQTKVSGDPPCSIIRHLCGVVERI